MTISVMVFTRDLRLIDNPALTAAAEAATVPVHFVHAPSEALLYALYQQTSLYVFPAVEDFGIMPVEAMAAGAPVLAQSVAYLECEVRQPVEVGNHTLFLGEIVNAAFLKDEDTEVLRMEDTRMNYGG